MSTINIAKADINKLTIGFPDHIGETSHFYDLKYSKQQLVFQTPKLIFYRKDASSKYFSICFYNYGFSEETKTFINTLADIEKRIHMSSPDMWKRIGETSKNKEFISSIRYSSDKKKAYINLGIQMDKGLPIAQVYDIDKKQVTLDYITDGSTGYCIVYLKGVWRSGTKMGLSFYLVQAKAYLPIYKLDRCVITDPDEEKGLLHYHTIVKPTINIGTQIPIEDKEQHPTYGKYVKMKRMGIPEPAIAIRCSTDGICFKEFLAYLSGEVTTMSEAPLPIALPLPMANKINPMMLQGVQLKKVSKEELEAQRQKKLMSKLKIENPSGFQPPSSNDLLDILKKLKKTIAIERDT